MRIDARHTHDIPTKRDGRTLIRAPAIDAAHR
jgi:hypothetical protein